MFHSFHRFASQSPDLNLLDMSNRGWFTAHLCLDVVGNNRRQVSIDFILSLKNESAKTTWETVCVGDGLNVLKICFIYANPVKLGCIYQNMSTYCKQLALILVSGLPLSGRVSGRVS